MANGHRSSGSSGSIAVLVVLIVVAVLYFARAVLIPLALSVLVSFLLAPLVIRLRHWGLGRVTSAASVVLFSFIVVGIISTAMFSQLVDLAHKLPEYQNNVHQKLESIRDSGGTVVNRISRVVGNLTEELTPRMPPSARNKPPEERPVPVEIRPSPFSPMEVVQKILGSVLEGVLMASIVVVFVIFMLIEREALRDRLIRLAGASRVNLTTKVLDDTAHRVSRYLLAQLVLNVGYGVVAGIGLYLIQVPNPVLWAILAALLRYVPYLGIWIAAIMPAAVAFAVEPGWVMVPAVFAIYFGIDLFMYNFAEPYLYGTSTGVSPLAILVAAVFWTWLWGPVGLLLATPLTVCVVVVGRHVPNLGFLQVLLSDEPVLTSETRFYQRMLAMDLEEATEVAEEFLKGKSLEELYDKVVIPALSLAEEDRHWGRLDDTRQQYIFQNTRILLEDLAERAEVVIAGSAAGKMKLLPKGNAPEKQASAELQTCVVCIPARDQADELAAFMVTQLLTKRGIGAKLIPSGTLVGESLDEVSREQPKVACVLAVPPLGYMHARYICRRLRSQFPNLKIIGAILTEQAVDEIKQRQPPIAADELACSVREVQNQILNLFSVRMTANPSQSALTAA